MKRLPLLTKFFLGFSLFMIIPLITIGFLFYYNVMCYYENELSKSSLVNLQIVKRLNDELVDSITKQTIRLSLDVVLQKIDGIKNYSELHNNMEYIGRFVNINQILADTVNLNYRINSIYVYYDNADYVITSNHGIVMKNEFTDTAWIEEYNKNKEKSTGTLWLNSRSSDLGSDVITFILPLNSLTLNYDCAIVVNVYERDLYSMMNKTSLGTDGFVFIVDNNGKVISHKDKSIIGKDISDESYIKKILSARETGYFTETLNNKTQLFSYYKSETNNWIYVGIIPMNTLIDKAISLRNTLILLILVLMSIGIIASFFFSRSMYNPVKKLMLDIQKRKGIDFKEAGNEMAILSKVFDSLARQEDSLSSELEKSKRQLQDKYITDLLEGNINNIALKDNNTGVEFRSKYFLCVLIAVDKYESFIERNTPDQQYYIKMMVLKTCEEITESIFQVRGILYEKNKIAVVINSEDYHPEKTREKLCFCLSALQKEVGKVMNNTISFGVSRCYDEICSLNNSFSEAKGALANRIIKGSGSIIFYEDIFEVEYRYFYPYHSETHIINFMKLGSRQELYGAIDELIDEIRNRAGISSDNIIQIFIQLIGNTVKFLVEMNINIANIFGSDYNIYQKLSSKETLDDIKVWLTGFYSGVLQYLSDSGDMNKSNATDRVIDYLYKNYRTNIDTTSIATSTGLGYATIGRIVKNKTGKNVLDYINGLRIEEAKRLLRQTNINVADIANNVGYNNKQSFSRFFKKFEGVTPGEFRNLQNSK